MAKTASKSEKIRTLLAKGMEPAKIAEKVGSSVNYVYMVKSKGKHSGKKRAKRGNGGAPVEVTATGLPAVTSVALDEAIEKLTAKLSELQAFKDSLANALAAL